MATWKKTIRPLLLCLLILIGGAPGVATATGEASSTNYSVDQVTFDSGTQNDACSTNFCADQSAGDLAVGNTKSTNYQATAGSQTQRQEYLQFIVNPTSINTGGLSTASAYTATATFSVKTYLASGYVVVNASPAPQNGSYTMASPSTPTSSTPGTEQFGMNVVANTTGCGAPANFGANPSQNPDSTFSFGQAASGYNTCGKFKYVNGDTIASSTSSSGETDYTISYIFNISNVTPGGTYTMTHVLVATSTF